MASIIRRPDSPFLWFKWRTASGQLRRAATQFRKDDPAQLKEAERALAMIAQQEENIRRTGEEAPLTLRRWAERWVEQRKREGLTSARDDEAGSACTFCRSWASASWATCARWRSARSSRR